MNKAADDLGDLSSPCVKQRSGRGIIVLTPKHEHILQGELCKNVPLSAFLPSNVTSLYHSYPLKFLVPQHISRSACCWVYCVVFGGGLVEGDNINISIEIGERCAAMIVTQSSTKVYHAINGKISKQNFTCHLDHGALLAVVPDPVVCYKNSLYSQTQEVFMKSTSNLLLLDWYTAGRIALEELWQFSRLESRTQLYVEGSVILQDANVLQNLPNVTLAQHFGIYMVFGLLVIIGPAFKEISSNMVKELNKPIAFGAKHSTDFVMGISDVRHNIGNTAINGCVIRFLSTSLSHAYEKLHMLLEPTFDVLGGNPFHNKF